MAPALDFRQKKCAVIEFLCCENMTVADIQKRLRKVYGYDADDLSTFSQWASRFSGESGHANIRDFSRSDRLHNAQTPDNVQFINNLSLADKRVTVKELSLQMGVGEMSVWSIETVAVEKGLCQVS